MLKSVTKKGFGGCPHDCPDTCSMIYEIKDNKLISVTGKQRSSIYKRRSLCESKRF